jgi:hypothetical protein
LKLFALLEAEGTVQTLRRKVISGDARVAVRSREDHGRICEVSMLVSRGFDAGAESAASACRRDSNHDHFVSWDTGFTRVRTSKSPVRLDKSLLRALTEALSDTCSLARTWLPAIRISSKHGFREHLSLARRVRVAGCIDSGRTPQHDSPSSNYVVRQSIRAMQTGIGCTRTHRSQVPAVAPPAPIAIGRP